MQQLLPFTVLKQYKKFAGREAAIQFVATALTVYGIETDKECIKDYAVIQELQQLLPFTVLKLVLPTPCHQNNEVATALTVYGIETRIMFKSFGWSMILLQQLLPFTVLKP